MKAEKYPQAVAAYQEAVRADPKDGELRLKLAAAYGGARQWPEYARQSIQAADLLPDREDAQTQAVEGLVILGRFEDARERVGPLLARKPDDLRLTLHFANARAQLRGPSWALQTLDGALRSGQSIEGARVKIRPATVRADDEAAETAYRRAYALGGQKGDARQALAGFLWVSGRTDEAIAILREAADDERGNPLLSRSLGLYYEHAGKLQEAEKYLRGSASTTDRDSALVLAGFLSRTNRSVEALAALEPVSSANDPDGAGTLLAGEIELALGKHAAALGRAEKVLAKNANHAPALRLKAQALLAAGDQKQAVAVARVAVQAAPTSRDGRLILGKALAASGDLSHAFDEYREAWRADTRDSAVAKTLAELALALGRHGIAEDLANQSLRLQPGDLQATLIYVRAQVRLGNYTAAQRKLTDIVKTAPPSPQILALQGSILAAQGNENPARAAFTKALQMDPDSLDALGGLVDLELKTGRASSVRSSVDQAVDRHSKDPAFLILRARIEAAEGNASGAEAAVRSILATDRGREDALRLLATLLARQGRHKEAQTTIEAAVAAAPGSSDLRLLLGTILEQQDLIPEARAQYEKVIVDNQLSGATTEMIRLLHTASARLAALLADRDLDRLQALQLASTAKRSFPTDPYISDTLGWVYVKNDRATLGLPHIEAAVRAEPDNAVYRYHLGAACEQLAEFDRARTELTRALALDPKFLGADKARALLRSIGR